MPNDIYYLKHKIDLELKAARNAMSYYEMDMHFTKADIMAIKLMKLRKWDEFKPNHKCLYVE